MVMTTTSIARNMSRSRIATGTDRGLHRILASWLPQVRVGVAIVARARTQPVALLRIATVATAAVIAARIAISPMGPLLAIFAALTASSLLAWVVWARRAAARLLAWQAALPELIREANARIDVLES
jgi:Flp pilus assembly protein TadB